ncbi:MAG TPA: hemerythrin domain-containing protein, partial [Syntrophorhabdaceae bacterium]
VVHEYNECYLYHSFMEKELDPRIRKIWELHLDMELGHLRNAVELMGRYTKKDAQELLPKRLPAPIVFEPNIKYVRDILESQVNLTAVGMDFKPVEQVDKNYRYFTYQNMVNGGWVPSEEVIEQHTEKFGEDYRLDLTFGERTDKVRAAEYYGLPTPSNDIFTLLKKEHNEVKLLFQKIKIAAHGKDALFSELAENLSLHMEGEEQLFYAKLQENPGTRDLVREAYEEHSEAKRILKDMENIPLAQKEWMSMVNQLQQSVEHHIEEEEMQLFPKAHDIIDQIESRNMAKDFQSDKQVNFQTTSWIKEPHERHATIG